MGPRRTPGQEEAGEPLSRGAGPCACASPVGHRAPRLVLTGAPGAGKTAVLEVLRRHLCGHVVLLPDAAAMLFRGGLPRPPDDDARRATQVAIYHLQDQLERMALGAGDPALVVCDRGVLDGVAYWPGEVGDYHAATGGTRERVFARYAAVVHVRAPAEAGVGAIDARLLAAWDGHPRRLVVEGEADFLGTLRRVLAFVREQLPACCRASTDERAPVTERRSPMSQPDFDPIVTELGRRAGVAPALASRTLAHVLDALDEVLADDELAALRACLPDELRGDLPRVGCRPLTSVDALFDRVQRLALARRPVVVERTEVACRLLGERLPPDAAARWRRDLPPAVSALFFADDAPPAPDAPAPRPAPPASEAPATLATGRPGSAHPVSEARPETAHAHSVARADEPHADTKLSSSRGLTQERLHETLAEGAVGGEKPPPRTR